MPYTLQLPFFTLYTLFSKRPSLQIDWLWQNGSSWIKGKGRLFIPHTPGDLACRSKCWQMLVAFIPVRSCHRPPDVSRKVGCPSGWERAVMSAQQYLQSKEIPAGAEHPATGTTPSTQEQLLSQNVLKTGANWVLQFVSLQETWLSVSYVSPALLAQIYTLMK